MELVGLHLGDPSSSICRAAVVDGRLSVCCASAGLGRYLAVWLFGAAIFDGLFALCFGAGDDGPEFSGAGASSGSGGLFRPLLVVAFFLYSTVSSPLRLGLVDELFVVALEGLGDRVPAVAIGGAVDGILAANFSLGWGLDGVAELLSEAFEVAVVDPAGLGCGYIFVDVDAVGEDGGNACGEGFGGGDAEVFVVGGKDEEVAEG